MPAFQQQYPTGRPGTAIDPWQRIVDLLTKLVTLGFDVRQVRTTGAESAKAFNVLAVTDVIALSIPEAVPQTDFFTTLLIAFDATSGAGRFRVDGVDPTAGGIGMSIPAGGATLTILGAQNIVKFRVIAETGATLAASYTLFQ